MCRPQISHPVNWQPIYISFSFYDDSGLKMYNEPDHECARLRPQTHHSNLLLLLLFFLFRTQMVCFENRINLTEISIAVHFKCCARARTHTLIQKINSIRHDMTEINSTNYYEFIVQLSKILSDLKVFNLYTC